MKHVFSLSGQYDDQADEQLVALALKGDRKSLNQLVMNNQDYIFNIALKMLNVVEEAEDATQEILIKVITKLSQYQPEKARFRTWLYRIVFNHVLKMKQSRHEKHNVNFEKFFGFMDSVPDVEIPTEELEIMGVSIKEARIACTAGMLMCLDRTQRLTYIIGEVFRIDHKLAGEIFEISPANFRKRLSLARKDLHQWMHRKCGLVNTNNPCRCRKKTRKFIEMGIVNPENLKWQSNFSQQIFTQMEEKLEVISLEADQIYARFYQEDPFKVSLKAKEVLDVISQSEFMELSPENFWRAVGEDRLAENE
ncbi:MAG: RNA polymerase sigma factor [Bacteroidota bacterium]